MFLNPEYIFRTIECIHAGFPAAHGITALVLDVDNTLTRDSSQELDPTVQNVAGRDARAAGIRLTIVSNNTAKRVRPFALSVWGWIGCRWPANRSPLAWPLRAAAWASQKSNGHGGRPDLYGPDCRGAVRHPVPIPCRRTITTSTKLCSSSAGLNPTGWTGITKKGAAWYE